MIESKIKTLFYQSPIFAEMLNKLDNFIYIYDETGHLVFMNHAAEKFENVTLSDMIGHHIQEDYLQDYSPSLAALETKQEVSDMQNTYTLRGKHFSLASKSYPLFLENKLIGVYTVQSDVTTFEKMFSENLQYQSKTTPAANSAEPFSQLIGQDEMFLKCVDIARLAAQNDSNILLTGPTGSGKEVFAKSIHKASSRRNNPFFPINCAAIPDALFESILFGTTKGSFTGATDKVGILEQAKSGTLFLDELNSMPLSSQAKLLRVLEEKEFRMLGGNKNIKTDVRIISSMNATQTDAIESHALREDLFFRLSVVNIEIPPLCQRGNDILLLADHFIQMYSKKFHKNIAALSHDTKNFFLEYQWPGNVRQLRHVIESATSLAPDTREEITMNMLPQYIFEKTHMSYDTLRTPANLVTRPANVSPVSKQGTQTTEDTLQGTSKEEVSETDTTVYDTLKAAENEEKKQIIQTLIANKGNVSKSAKLLGMHRQSLIYRIKKYGIKVK